MRELTSCLRNTSTDTREDIQSARNIYGCAEVAIEPEPLGKSDVVDAIQADSSDVTPARTSLILRGFVCVFFGNGHGRTLCGENTSRAARLSFATWRHVRETFDI